MRKIGNLPKEQLQLLIKKWSQFDSVGNIARELSLSKPTIYSWRRGEAKLFSDEILEAIASALSLPDSQLLVNYMAKKIEISELWSATKFSAVRLPEIPSNTVLPYQYPEVSDLVAKMIDEVGELYAKEDENVYTINNKNTTNINPLIVLNEVIEQVEYLSEKGIVKTFDKLNILKKIEVLRELLKMCNKSNIQTLLTELNLKEHPPICFSSLKEVRVARAVLRESVRLSGHHKISNLKEKGVYIHLLDYFFHPEREDLYIMQKQWNAEEFFVLIKQCYKMKAHELIKLESGEGFRIIMGSSTYESIDEFLLDIKYVAGTITLLGSKIRKCLKSMRPDELYHLDLKATLVGINSHLWYEIKTDSGQNEYPIDVINRLVAVIDCNYRYFSRDEWLKHAIDSKEESVSTEEHSLLVTV